MRSEMMVIGLIFAIAAWGAVASAHAASGLPRLASAGSAQSNVGIDQTMRPSTHPGVVLDDRGRPVASEPRASRIVSLAPHATDLVVTLGAPDRLIAVDRHSDAPQVSVALPRLASYPAIDPERVASLKPDLVLLWGEGLAAGTLARLEALGLRVFVSQPRTLDDVAGSLERIGALIDTASDPNAIAVTFRTRAAALTVSHARTPEIPVFVQLWEVPLITLGSRSVMADAMHRCGVRNVFAASDAGSQRVSPEAVLAAAPQLILSTVQGSTDSRWRQLGLVGTHPGSARFVRLEEPALERPSPPVLEALARVCALMDAAVPRAR